MVGMAPAPQEIDVLGNPNSGPVEHPGDGIHGTEQAEGMPEQRRPVEDGEESHRLPQIERRVAELFLVAPGAVFDDAVCGVCLATALGHDVDSEDGESRADEHGAALTFIPAYDVESPHAAAAMDAGGPVRRQVLGALVAARAVLGVKVEGTVAASAVGLDVDQQDRGLGATVVVVQYAPDQAGRY